MNIKYLCNMQKVLDERIVKNHKLEGINLEENKILALIVEISELANETRCFKHWSTKGPSEEKVLLEEYVDSLHFFLSIANEKGYDIDHLYAQYKENFSSKPQKSIVKAFIELIEKVILFEQKQTAYYFIDSFATYIHLGELLGFSLKQIQDAYVEKNEINHKRQDSGY